MKFLLAVLSGCLLALSFPNVIDTQFTVWPSTLAWIALVPLLFTLEKHGTKEAFYLGWICGTSFFALSLYWITWIKELQYFAWPGLFLLSAFLGLYVALWTWGYAFLEEKSHLLAIMAGPFLWSLLEYARGH